MFSKNDDFNKLLPLNKKKIWNSFFVESVTSSAKQNNTRWLMPLSTKQIKRTNFLNKTNEIFKPRDSFNSNNSSQKRDIKNISLGLLSLKITQCQSRGRLDFFKNYLKAQKQSIIFENAEEFYGFIKIFPSHDAIKLLDLPYIKDQIKNLGQQKFCLTQEAYDSLLSYLPKNFNKRLLNSITPITKRLSVGIFKGNNNPNPSMPDLIPQLKI